MLKTLLIAGVIVSAVSGCSTAAKSDSETLYPKNANLKTLGGPLVQAHRGARYEYDDNAAGGFKWCLERGVRGFELDVRFTGDRKLIVMHDSKVNRTTDGQGCTEEMKFDDIRRLRLRKSKENVPSAEEVFEVFRGRGDVFIEIEMKAGLNKYYTREVLEEYCRKLNAAAKSILEPGTYAFTCFGIETLEAMRRIDPLAPIGYIVGSGLTQEHIDTAKRLKCCGVASIATKTSKEMIDRAHAQGLTICLWMVQSKDAYDEAKKKGADRITSDKPVEILKAISGR